jgi:hypothetical protein
MPFTWRVVLFRKRGKWLRRGVKRATLQINRGKILISKPPVGCVFGGVGGFEIGNAPMRLRDFSPKKIQNPALCHWGLSYAGGLQRHMAMFPPTSLLWAGPMP